MTNIRIPFWDNVKGILIFLVVLGHTGTALGNNWLSVIYAFHMPLFIFISGYFSRKKTTLWETIGKLVYIFLFFNTVYLLLDVALGESLTLKNLISPGFSMWYILSLIFWRTILYFLHESILAKKEIMVSVAVFFSLIAGFIPIGPQLSFQRTFAFFPFFITGYICHQTDIHLPREGKCTIVCVIAALLFISLSILNYYKMPVFYANRPYFESTEVFLRLIHLSIAFILGASILCLVPNKYGIITKIGESSLIIYLMHPPIVKGLKSLLMRGVTFNPLIAVGIALFSIGAIYCVRNIGPFRWLR